MLPAEVNSRRILLQEVDQSVWSADKDIWTQKHRIQTRRGKWTSCFIFHTNICFLLPYFLFDCGPYFLAAREALSMMWTLNPTPSDRRSSSLWVWTQQNWLHELFRITNTNKLIKLYLLSNRSENSKKAQTSVSVYLTGQFSGWRDDQRSEAQVCRLLQVGEQRNGESQRFPWSCGSAGQDLPTLSDGWWDQTSLHSTTMKHVSVYSRASWAVSPASGSALASWVLRLWGSEEGARWDDTPTAAPQMCTRGRARHCRAHLYGV